MNHTTLKQDKGSGQSGADPDYLNLPPRDPLIERTIAHALKDMFNMQRVRYDENPPRDLTFSDLLRQNPYYHDNMLAQDGTPPNRAFAYRLKSMKSDDDGLIPIPREKFWHLLRPMTSLLLSDGHVQHYTTVYRIDCSNEAIDLLDFWPDKIFLKDGLNTQGIEAQIIEIPDHGKIVRVTRTELEKVIVGAISLESDTFYEHLLKAIPSGSNDPRFMLALSVGSLGHRISTEDPLTALNHAIAAFELTLKKPDKRLQLKIAKQLLYAKMFTSYWLHTETIDHETENKAIDAQVTAGNLLSSEYPDLSNEALSDNQLIRLGQLAYNVKLLQNAETYFSLVIERSPGNPEGYFGRAKTRNNMLSHEGVIADSTACINLVEREINDNQDTLTSDNRDAYKLLNTLASAPERRKFNYMLDESFALRGNAHVSIGNHREAELDGRTAISINPQDYQGYMTVATSLNERGRHYQALPFYAMVRQLASHPNLKEGVHMLMQGITEQAKQSGPGIKHGYIIQETILFRGVEDFIEFKEMTKTNQHFKPGENSYICTLPQETYVLIQGEEHSGCMHVEADVSLFESRRWSKAISEDEFQEGVVRGVVFDFDVILLPLDYWSN